MGNNLSASRILRINRGRIAFFDRSIGCQVNKAELEMAAVLAASKSAGTSDGEGGTKMMHIEQLPNDLWIEIMSYLTYLDLQQLRLVSWRCRELVNRRYFATRGRVIVTTENLEDMKEHVESHASYINFEDVELRNLSQSPELEQFMRLVGKEVRCLLLRHSPVFESIHGKVPNLKMLKIATTSFLDDDNMTMDGINMKQFQQLDGFECDGVSLDANLKQLMLLQLRSVENEVRLRHLLFEYRRNNELVLLQVLYDHAHTLESVDIFFSCSPGIETEDWRQTFERMFRLRTLKLSGNCHLMLLQVILDAIPKTAQLKHLDLTGMLSLSNELLVQVARKWRNTLSYVDLMFCVQLDARCVKALSKMSDCLESLTMSYCRAMTGRGLVEGLATKMNYTLQELFLEDVCFIDENSMCALLERCPNLRKLSLDNCQKATTDRTLATICQHQKLLRVLRIDYCIKITDNGFMGSGKHPYSISRLQGLRELNVRGCRNITQRLLKRALRLPELVSLTMDYCNRLDTKGIAALTVNCPSLEMLSVASCSLLDDAAVQFVVLNLSRLRTLNISNCPLLTLQSFSHIARYADNLRELVACSIDGLDQEAAQSILDLHLPELKKVML